MTALERRIITFVTGFSLMLVQIVSGRSLAPYIGTSIFTWTSIIATTLLGVVLGNLVGGLLADRRGGRKTIAISLLAAAGSIVFANYMLVVTNQMFGAQKMFLILRSLLYTVLVFFPPAFLLSTLSPQLVKADISDIKFAGRAVGSLSFWNSLGSILGTLLGGYVLISTFGTKGLLTGIGLVLVALGFWAGRSLGLWKSRLVVLMALLFVGDFFTPSICRIETDYFCIRVQNSPESDGQARYTLRLDHLVHSYVTPSDPARLGYGYENIYAQIIASRSSVEDEFSAYFIGGGGYVLPRYLESFYPNAAIKVAEIDPGVTKANYDLMELPRDTRIVSVNDDARQNLMRDTEGKYDYVFGDAFDDFSVPYHLTTLEFHRLLKSRMAEEGVYAMNIIDDARYGKFLAAMYQTLSSVWQYVYIAPNADFLEPGRRNTIVLIASDEPIDTKAWEGARSFSASEADFDKRGQNTAKFLLSDEVVEQFLAKRKQGPLTDDYVPVERYLAPVFSEAY